MHCYVQSFACRRTGDGGTRIHTRIMGTRTHTQVHNTPTYMYILLLQQLSPQKIILRIHIYIHNLKQHTTEVSEEDTDMIFFVALVDLRKSPNS